MGECAATTIKEQLPQQQPPLPPQLTQSEQNRHGASVSDRLQMVAAQLEHIAAPSQAYLETTGAQGNAGQQAGQGRQREQIREKLAALETSMAALPRGLDVADVRAHLTAEIDKCKRQAHDGQTYWSSP